MIELLRSNVEKWNRQRPGGFIDLQHADLRDADLHNADLRNAHLRNANLQGVYLRGVNLSNADLSNADLRGVKLPSPTIVLLASWGFVSDALCADLMRYDAGCSPDAKAFTSWARGGPCPYGGARVQRAANFAEKKSVWKPGRTKRPYDLMVRCIQENCANSDFHGDK